MLLYFGFVLLPKNGVAQGDKECGSGDAAIKIPAQEYAGHGRLKDKKQVIIMLRYSISIYFLALIR